MKIRLLSDLHLEGNKYPYTFKGEDVLVLAGDIHTADRHYQLIERVPNTVKILMVAGNHEYYNSDFDHVNARLKSMEAGYPNLTVLLDEETELGGFPVFGGTMYTNFRLYPNHPLSEILALRHISDFHVSNIMGENGKLRRWTVEDHKATHEAFRSKFIPWLERTADAEKRLVITHFVPTLELTHPRWLRAGNRDLNPYFTCDMTEFMGWKGLWVCGHTHDSGTAKVGETELYCNPHGYGTENIHFNDNLLLDF